MGGHTWASALQCVFRLHQEGLSSRGMVCTSLRSAPCQEAHNFPLTLLVKCKKKECDIFLYIYYIYILYIYYIDIYEREKRRCSYGIAICLLQIQHAAAATAAAAAAAAASAAAFGAVSLVLCLGRPSGKRLRPVHFFA